MPYVPGSGWFGLPHSTHTPLHTTPFFTYRVRCYGLLVYALHTHVPFYRLVDSFFPVLVYRLYAHTWFRPHTPLHVPIIPHHTIFTPNPSLFPTIVDSLHFHHLPTFLPLHLLHCGCYYIVAVHTVYHFTVVLLPVGYLPSTVGFVRLPYRLRTDSFVTTTTHTLRHLLPLFYYHVTYLVPSSFTLPAFVLHVSLFGTPLVRYHTHRLPLVPAGSRTYHLHTFAFPRRTTRTLHTPPTYTTYRLMPFAPFRLRYCYHSPFTVPPSHSRFLPLFRCTAHHGLYLHLRLRVLRLVRSIVLWLLRYLHSTTTTAATYHSHTTLLPVDSTFTTHYPSPLWFPVPSSVPLHYTHIY